MTTIALANVTVTRRRQIVLRDVSHDFGPGITALLGNNGAGKSTLLLTILGLLATDAGVVKVGGHKMGGPMKDRAIFRQIGWMPQEPRFTPGIRVKDAVAYAAWLRGVENTTGEAVREAIEAVNLTHLRSRPSQRLSGGELRRLGLACTLVGNPRFLLLDEPTAGLDVAQRAALHRVLSSIAPRHTIIISTHLIDDVVDVADRLMVLDAGQVAHTAEMPNVSASTVARADRIRLIRDMLLDPH